MDALTRRRFLLASGVAGASALAAGAGGLTLAQLLQTALSAPRDGLTGVNKVVLVTLYGGNDGLNTVIPYTDSAYHSKRPDLAYPPERVLHLNESLGLNPALSGLRQLWDAKQLAIVLGVGYPKPDRSHFRSMDIWQSASPVAATSTGWIGRWLDGTKAPAEAAVSLEPVLPPLLVGQTRAGACVSLDGLKLPKGINVEMLTGLGQSEPDEPALQRQAAIAYDDLIRMDQLLHEAEASSVDAEESLAGPATGTGGSNALVAQLSLVARCVEAGVPTRVYSVSLGGFDTHAGEQNTHEALLKRLDGAISGFVTRMAKTPEGRQVTVVIYSEFGRRVQGNASQGTDHGTAGPVFVLGPRVAGGLYGEQPSLTDLDNGDLKANVDFRDLYGTLLATVLNADPAQYIRDYKVRDLPLFTSA